MCVARSASVEINLTEGYLPKHFCVIKSSQGRCVCVCVCVGGGEFVPINDIISECKVAALFWREAPRWTPDAIWFLRYFNPQAHRTLYLECRKC